MEYITLNNGLKMPMLGYGVYGMDDRETEHCTLKALELGYRLIDTAQYYHNEAGVGRALKRTKVPREEIFVTTKVQSNQNVRRELMNSLARLQCDYVDLVLIHWPMGNDLTTYRVLEELCREGKIRSLGLSNFYREEYWDICNHAEIMPAVSQQETHIYHQNKRLYPLYEKQGVVLEAWSPLGAGQGEMLKDDLINKIAAVHGKTPAQIILRFLLQNKIVCIPKTSHEARMKENLAVFDFSLTAEEMAAVSNLDRNESLFGWYE